MALKIFCFPHAGGSAAGYFWLKRGIERMHSQISVTVCEYNGHGRKINCPFYSSLSEGARRLAVEIRECQEENIVLFGHSMGAYMAIETAAFLQDSFDRRVSAVIVSGQDSPVNQQMRRAERTDEELLAYLQSLGGMSPVITENKEYRNFFLSIIREDMRILDSYRSGEKCLHCPLCIMYGEEDMEIDKSLLSSWKTVTTERVQFQCFSGGHFYLMEHREQVLAFMDSLLYSLNLIR